MNQQSRPGDSSFLQTPAERQHPETATVEELRQSLRQSTPMLPKTNSDKLTQTIGQIQNSLRSQQLTTETQLQTTLSQSATGIVDAQAFNQLQQLGGQLAQAAQTGPEVLRSNSQQLMQVIQQLQSTLAEQMTRSGDMVAQALNQAVTSMAGAQAAMFRTQALTQINEQIKQCNESLRTFTSPNDMLH